jgi:hypothetical protein
MNNDYDPGMAAGGGGGNNRSRNNSTRKANNAKKPNMTLNQARTAMMNAVGRRNTKKIAELKAIIDRLAPPASKNTRRGKGKSAAERRANEEARKRAEAEKEARLAAVLEAVEEAEEVKDEEGLEEVALEVIEAGKSGMLEETMAALKRLRALRGAAASAASVEAQQAATKAKEAAKKAAEKLARRRERERRGVRDELQMYDDYMADAAKAAKWQAAHTKATAWMTPEQKLEANMYTPFSLR